MVREWRAPRCYGNLTRSHYNGFGQLVALHSSAQDWQEPTDGCGSSSGGRVLRSVANGPVQYVYFPHYETSVQGGVTTITKSYFFGGVRIAQKVGSGPVTYLHSDHLGSTVLTTGVSGSKKYHAYGNTRSGSVPTDWQFTGQEQDGTGLVYLHARYYDPATGVFFSPDTIVPERNASTTACTFATSSGRKSSCTSSMGRFCARRRSSELASTVSNRLSFHLCAQREHRLLVGQRQRQRVPFGVGTKVARPLLE